VIDASFRSTNSLERTVTVPRSNGPATAGETISNPNGSPPEGPVMNTFPPVSVNGSLPKPATAVASPIWLCGGHPSLLACAAEHNATLDNNAALPGGKCIAPVLNA